MADEPEAVEPTDAPGEAPTPEPVVDPVEAQQRLLGSIAARQGLARSVFRRFGWQAEPAPGTGAGPFGPGAPPIVAAPRIPARSPFMSVVGAAEQRRRDQQAQPLGTGHERIEHAAGAWAPEELFWWHRLSPAARMLGRRHESPPPMVRTHVPPPEPPEFPIVRADPPPEDPPPERAMPKRPAAGRPKATHSKPVEPRGPRSPPACPAR